MRAGTSDERWSAKKRRQRGRRALERQLDYQRAKAAGLGDARDAMTRNVFVRAQAVRRRIEEFWPVPADARVIEVGSGPHGLIFGLAQHRGVGIDPLAVEYSRLFPFVQSTAPTVAAIGEELPFADGTFDLVLSDNVIDHAEQPLAIVDELVRVLRPGGLLYFTVNVHHPFYGAASAAHGFWNAAGLKFELSAFADHTVHFTERAISSYFDRLPLNILSRSSTVDETRQRQRHSPAKNADALLKRAFFKNALFELIAVRSDVS